MIESKWYFTNNPRDQILIQTKIIFGHNKNESEPKPYEKESFFKWVHEKGPLELPICGQEKVSGFLEICERKVGSISWEHKLGAHGRCQC